jgi:ubiquinone/menaquinone biosynthesis C-methylase UbiE
MTSAWRGNHPWAIVYDFIVERSAVGKVLWKVGMNSDISKLYAAADELGTLPDGAAVLDIPCGGGVALRGVRPGQKLRYVAADISEDMLERTRKEAARRGIEVELRAADVGALPFDDQTFDMVVAFTSLHCFPDPAKAVRELSRVLKPGGVISGSAFLTDGGIRHKPMIAAGRVAGLLGPSGTTKDLRRWLSMAGFTDVTLDRSGGITYFRGRK